MIANWMADIGYSSSDYFEQRKAEEKLKESDRAERSAPRKYKYEPYAELRSKIELVRRAIRYCNRSSFTPNFWQLARKKFNAGDVLTTDESIVQQLILIQEKLGLNEENWHYFGRTDPDDEIQRLSKMLWEIEHR